MKDESKRGFVALIIPAELLNDPNLTITDKVFLAEINALEHAGECFASNKHFQNFSNLSKSRVSNILSNLKSKGYISVKMFYKEGSKQISKRVIKMNRYKFEGLAEPTLPVSNTNTPVSNTGIPHFENDKDSITLLDKHTRTTSSKKDHRHKHKKHVYDKDSDYYKLSEFFVKQILNNNPNFKKPNIQKWSDDFRIMIERDHRDKHQVAKLILWVQHDSFWMANVLSPTKLREKYDSLVMRMNNSSEPHVSNQSKIEKPENKIDSKKKDELLKQARERDQKVIEEE